MTHLMPEWPVGVNCVRIIMIADPEDADRLFQDFMRVNELLPEQCLLMHDGGNAHHIDVDRLKFH